MPGRILDREVGGNSTYARNLAQRLRENGHQILSIPAKGSPLQNIATETRYGLTAIGYDLVHYVADTGPVIRAKVPSVVTVHGVASRWISVARSNFQETVWRRRVSMAIRNTDKVISVSKSSAEDICHVFGVERARIHVIYHGIDPFYFEQATAEEELELAPKLPKQPFVLFVGNIEPRKNIESLVAAFDLAPLRSLGMRLVIAGKPAWNFGPSMKAITASDHVDYLGFVSEEFKRLLLQRCAVFAFPSHYEGFGFPVLEALASGAVVACTDSGSLAEVAGPALRISGHSAEEIAMSLYQAISDQQLRAACESDGREWARRFTWDASARQHIGVYQSVAVS